MVKGTQSYQSSPGEQDYGIHTSIQEDHFTRDFATGTQNGRASTREIGQMVGWK